MGYLFVDDARARLKAAEDLLDEGTQRVLDRIGVATGWQCLEIGAGGGSIARWLADRVGPQGRVVATDISTRDLDRSGRQNLEVRQHDIVNDPLETDTYDLVHARLLLEHLPARDVAFRKLVESLKPGGV